MTKSSKIKRSVKERSVARKSAVKKGAQVKLTDPEESIWQSLYVLAEHWQSDLKFFSDEMKFLRNLIDKYFMWLIDEKNIESTRLIAERLSILEKRRVENEQKISNHLHHLTNLVENPFPHNSQEYRDEHGDLETAFTDFTKDFRTIKKEVFKLTEEVIESEKARHLLSS